MSEVAVMTIRDVESPSPSLPPMESFDQWREVGQTIALQKRSLEWAMADWITHGRAHYPEQCQIALSGILIDEKSITRMEKTAKAFPPHLRNAKLSFEHHAHVAGLPVQQSLDLLQQAQRQNLTPRELRIEAMIRKVETGLTLPREEDIEDDAMLACVRAWNRAPRIVREDFAEMVSQSGLGLIEYGT